MCRMAILMANYEEARELIPKVVESIIKAASNDPYGDALYGERQHRDGWGFLLLSVDDSRRIIHYRSVKPIFEDPSTDMVIQYLSTLSPNSTVLLMIHARAASTNTPINLSSTHPVSYVTRGGAELYMIHNGSFRKDEIVRELGIGSTFASKFNDTYIANMALAQRIYNDEISYDNMQWLLSKTKTGANLGIALIGGSTVSVVIGSLYRMMGDGKDNAREVYYRFYRCILSNGVFYASSTVIDHYKPQGIDDCEPVINGEYHVYNVGKEGGINQVDRWIFNAI